VLQVHDLRVEYDGLAALHGISFRVDYGEVVAIVGSNGAGKSTTLKAISGLVRPSAGQIIFEGKPIHRMPAHAVTRLGIAHVPEGRRLFQKLTVLENLKLGAYVRQDRSLFDKSLQLVFEVFPRLKERMGQRAGTLSGGEQQMLAIARGLMLNPKLLMLDEPSLGIAPKLVSEIFEVLANLNRRGTTILLVEQNVREALELAHRGYVLQTGEVIMEGSGQELLESDLVRRAYLGL
jgi:branched-chain amino acid transport system ATP-binding protein